MRVLWFTNTPSCYKPQKGGYNGGGWISSLETEIKKKDGIELGICFFLEDENQKIQENNVTYYPIKTYKYSLKEKIERKFSFKKRKDNTFEFYINSFLQVIKDFNPDIINVFGSEDIFGSIAQYTKIPTVLHIQGIITPYYTAFCPPKYSFNSIIFENLNPFKILNAFSNIKGWHNNAKREQKMLSHIPHFMGRTEWDKRITKIYAPNAKYHHCDELLRDIFYNNSPYRINNKTLTITTTISPPYYKGFDTIIQAASILKHQLNVEFIWNVYGINNIKPYEKKFKINAKDCNINIGGIISQETLYSKLLETTVFVHPSYIDNSPNSVCEAQILGCPVISTNVGGIPSLIENYKTGLLIPANDPYQMAFLIKEIFENKELANNISKAGREVAQKRHNKKDIIEKLINIYDSIIFQNIKNNSKD